MVLQGKYEYKLLTGSKSSEADKIFANNVSVTMPKLDPDTAKVTLARTADSIAVAAGDWVEYYRRLPGEPTWGNTLFYGRVMKRQVTARTVELDCTGVLGKIKGRTISGAAWGNTHVVDKEYAVALTQSATGALARLSLVLDAGLPAQVPLESLKVLRLREYISAGSSLASINVSNRAGATSQIAGAFTARGGVCRKLWVKGYRSGAGTTALTVEIQSDYIGAPSGTVIATMTLPYASVPNGAGNEAWFEIDLLRNVANAQVLNLNMGWQYWIVLRVATQDNALDYYFRYAFLAPTPISRVLEQDTGTGWGIIGRDSGLFFALDFGVDWEECVYGAGHDYLVQGDIDPPKLFFFKNNVEMGDIGGISNFSGKTFPILYSGQKLARITYWKGTITYATTIAKWAQAIGSDLYGTLDISITEPTNKQFCIQCENADGLEAFKLLRQFAPLTLRMYKNAAGVVVLEVRDEKAPDLTTWNLYTPTQKARRTFKHGFDTATPSEVRIIDDALVDEFIKETATSQVRDGGGGLHGISGTGSLFGGQVAVIGGSGGSSLGAITVSRDIYQTYNTIKRSGTITLAGVDQSVADGPFRSSNEIVQLVDSRTGFNGYYAVEVLTWSWAVGQPSEVALGLSSTIFAIFIASASPGGPTRMSSPKVPGTQSKINALKEGIFPSTGRLRAFAEGAGKGVTDAPLAALNQSGITRRAEDGIFYNLDAPFYDPLKYWWLRIGTGAPAGNNLGAQVAEIMALAVTTADGIVLVGHFHHADFSLATAWPQTITEVGIAYSMDEMKTGLTAVWAATIGTPSGAKVIFAEQPEMFPEKRIAAFVRLQEVP